MRTLTPLACALVAVALAGCPETPTSAPSQADSGVVATPPGADAGYVEPCLELADDAPCPLRGPWHPTRYGVCCDRACVDLSADPQHCGGCGKACQEGQGCLPDEGCVTLSCDGKPDSATCVTASGGEGDCCGGACSDLSSDPKNCGWCGKACKAGEFCDWGHCKPTPSCAPGQSNERCPLAGGGLGVCCEGSCVDPSSDLKACGGCGRGCPAGSVCVDGRCATAEGEPARCALLGCPAGKACDPLRNACLSPSCGSGVTGADCYFGATANARCCGGQCVDLLQDPLHCGDCGNACPSGVCLHGFAHLGPLRSVCKEYPQGCSGCPSEATCMEPFLCVVSDCRNSPLAGTLCSSNGMDGMGGVCCGLQPGDGCVDVAIDPTNCGRCGWACPLGKKCVKGACEGAGAECGPGDALRACRPEESLSFVCCPSGCVDLQADPKNCGTCGNACGADMGCLQGACLAQACTAATEGKACARGLEKGVCCSGACVDLKTDSANCGQCGQPCPGSSVCREAVCGLESCSAASAGAPCHRGGGALGTCCGKGCVDLKTDRDNCNGCGQACPTGKSCVAGVCK